MTKSLLISALMLSGCTTVSPVYLADGSQGHNISCSGAALNFSYCLERAGEICGARGYDVVNREGAAVPIAIAGSSFQANPYAASGSSYGMAGSAVSRNLFIKCK